MELLYLWIEEDSNRVIVNQEFNFSGRYRFNFKDGIMHSYLRESYPKSFFKLNHNESSKITNITAIVGENGSGKTTLLQFLKENLSYIKQEFYGRGLRYSYPAAEHKFIVIVKDQGHFYLYNIGEIDILDIDGDLLIETRDMQLERVYGDSDESDDYDDYENYNYNSDAVQYLIPELKKTKIIYFSNVLDTNHILNDFSYDFFDIFLDISTNTVLEQDAYDNNNQIQEILRQVRFLLSPNADKIIPKAPDFFLVHLKSLSEIMNRLQRKQYANEINISKISDKIKKSLNLITSIDEIIHSIIMVSVFEYIEMYESALEQNVISSKPKKVNITQILTKYLNSNRTPDTFMLMLKERIKKLRKTIHVDQRAGHPLRHKNDEYFDKCFQGRLDLIRLMPQFEDFIVVKNQPKIVIPFAERELIMQLLTYSEESDFSFRLLTFDLSGISSGERAMLVTYSRFYWLIDRSTNEPSYRRFGFTDGSFHTDHYRLRENLLILIDEGEVYLHPNWQREYLNNILNFFGEIFENCDDVKNIQIIMTSNSPFVISDLPKENIILLENRDGRSHVRAESDKFDTFGANIHLLLSDTFFMSKGLIGEFARNKMNAVIEFLNNDSEASHEQRSDMAYIISIIGEPVIRTKLQEMYDAKYNDDDPLKRVEHEIARLERERERILKKRKEDHDPNT
jgi:predicted ATP-dependent endonuclease of OLD family